MEVRFTKKPACAAASTPKARRLFARAEWAAWLVCAGCAGAAERSTPRALPLAPDRAIVAEAANVRAEPLGVKVPGEESCEQKGSDEPVDPSVLDAIAPERPAPSFDVTTVDCRRVDSRDVLGKRPFVLVFFSSWCHVCEKKMPIISAAARALAKDVAFLGVALDEPETWADVPNFLERHSIDFPIVRGARFKSFALSYDPVGSIPVVVIVGRDGFPVDMQVGYSPFDYNRLLGAVRMATAFPTEDRAAPDTVARPTFMAP